MAASKKKITKPKSNDEKVKTKPSEKKVKTKPNEKRVKAKPDFTIKYAGLTDIGAVRLNNEDSWSVDDEFGCYIVSDGMGGALAGEVASDMVANLLPDILKRELPDVIDDIGTDEVRTRLFRALAIINDMVCDRSAKDPNCAGMGATLVMILVRNGQAMVVHAGDSRAYLVRKNELSLLTKDHNMLQILLDEGVITPEEAVGHPAGCELLCDVGMPEGMFADVLYFDLEAGDRILLCSDGLNGMVPDGQIEHIMNKRIALKKISQQLIQAALEGGGHDNITALVMDIVAE